MTITPPAVLPGNILTLADSDFESGSPTWAALSGANAPTVFTTYPFIGSHALTWTASGTADTFIASGYYPCIPGNGYVASGYVNTLAGSHDTYVGCNFYTASHVLIGSTQFGNDNSSGTWGYACQAGGGFFGWNYFVLNVTPGIALPRAGDTFTWSGQPGVIFTVTAASTAAGQSSVSYSPNSSAAMSSGTVAQYTWQPVVAAVTSPSNAAFMKMVVWCGTNVVTSEPFAIDLMYLADTPVQVLVDWVNPAFTLYTAPAAGQDFMDLTPWVRLEQNISMTHGRQDAVSEIQAGQATFIVDNNTGWFTPQRSGSPYFPNIAFGARVQINACDQAGAWYTRFDGQISEIVYNVDATGYTNLATFSCSDVLAFLNRQDPMQCWTKQHVLAHNPLLHWCLNDNGETGLAAETSGNNGPPLRMHSYQSGAQVATITWADSSSGVETLANAASPSSAFDGSQFWLPGSDVPTSPVRGLVSGAVGPASTPLANIGLLPAFTTQSAQNAFLGTDGYQLSAELLINGIPTPLTPTSTGSDYTVEAWFTMDPAVHAKAGTNLGPYTVFCLGSTRRSSCLVAGLYYQSSNVNMEIATYAQPPAFPMTAYGTAPSIVASVSGPITADSIPKPHHLLLTIQGAAAGGVVTLYLDSVSIGTVTLPAGQIFDTISVGGAYGGHGNFAGNISCVTVYSYAFSQTEIEEHTMVGQYGMWEQPTDSCIAEIAEQSFVPDFWSNLQTTGQGLTLTDYYDISGQTPLSVMQVFEQTEQGLLYVDRIGRLSFHTRDWRMGYGAPDLSFPADLYDPDLGYELIDTFLLNEACTSTTTFTTGVDWLAQGSQNSYGHYTNGTQFSPVKLPLITWNRAMSVLGLAGYAYWGDPSLNDNSAWQVNTRSQPRLIPGQLTIDLLTLGMTGPLRISDFYGLDVDNMITLPQLPPASFPDQAGANDFFIEGINEVIGQQVRTLSYYTSPASIQRAWKPGDAVYGALGTTSRIGISAPDVSIPPALGKSVSHDGGGPYWPPAFTTVPATFQIGWTNITSATPTLTPSRPSVQGDCVLVQIFAASATSITVTDSQSNTYTQIGSVTLTGGYTQYLFACFNASPLNTTDLITMSTGLSQVYTTSAYDISGVAGVDGTTWVATGTSNSPSVTLGTLAAAGEFEMTIISNHGFFTNTIPSGWTQFGYNYQNPYDNQMFWRQATSTTGDTCATTLSGSTAWGAIGIAFTLQPYVLNNPANNGHQFIGATEIRGLRDTLALGLNPPMAVAGLVNHTQTFTTGNQGILGHAIWDTAYIDTTGGMSLVPAWPNWYTVTVPGFYEISACYAFQAQGSGAVGARAIWLVVAQGAAQKVAAGTGSPTSGDTYVCPVGEQVSPDNNSRNAAPNPCTRVYLGVGDMINVGTMQNQGANQNGSTGYHGPLMSLRWVGYGTVADQYPTVGLPGGGAPTPPPSGHTQYTKSWNATHTYSYYGTSSSWSPQLRSTDGLCYQSTWSGGGAAGSMFSFALFNYSAIASALSGATIQSCKLTMTNQHSWYNSGASLIIGWTTATSFGSSFAPGSGTHFNWKQVFWDEGRTQTVDIGLGIAQAFQSSSATALAFGNNSTEDLNYYGYWTGGSNPKLTITYTK